MFKKILVLTAICVAAMLCMGINNNYSYEKREAHVLVHEGQTIWGIAYKHFDRQNKYRSMNEFTWVIAQRNGLRGKHLQPGDIIVVPLEVRK